MSIRKVLMFSIAFFFIFLLLYHKEILIQCNFYTFLSRFAFQSFTHYLLISSQQSPLFVSILSPFSTYVYLFIFFFQFFFFVFFTSFISSYTFYSPQLLFRFSQFLNIMWVSESELSHCHYILYICMFTSDVCATDDLKYPAVFSIQYFLGYLYLK